MSKENRIFTDEELERLSRHKPDLIKEQIAARRFDEAAETLKSLDSSIKFLHDAAAGWIGGLMSYLYREYGESGLSEAESYALLQERRDALPKNPLPDYDGICRRVVSELKGLCGGELEVSEDDEKMTIRLCPCATGGMLIKAAKEDADAGVTEDGFADIKGVSALSFGESELPVYCSHCALSEIRDYQESGHLRVVHAADSVKTPKTETCSIYIYKDPDDIPDTYYRRLGLVKPQRSDIPAFVQDCAFSDAEMKHMNKSAERLVLDALDEGDAEAATALFDEYYAIKTHMHDAVGCRVGALLTWIYERDGLEGVDRAERYAHGIEGRIFMKPSEANDIKTIIIDNLHGLSGHVHQKNTLVEDDEKISVKVNPCGSGGRMIARGAYREGGGYAVLEGPSPLIWGIEKLPIYCFHCPLFERLSIERSGTLANIKTERYLQGDKCSACDFVFYKNAEDIPERYYTRSDKKKP